MKGVAEPLDELAAKDTAEYADGKEEGAASWYPAWVIRSEPACSNDAVDMRMKLQALIPAMEDTEETDLCSKMPGIASDLK
jgi:hypothetical protein